MTATPSTQTPADEFLAIVQDLLDLVDARTKVHSVFVAMFIYVSLRLGRVRDRLGRLVARFHAGKPPRSRAAPAATPGTARTRVRKPVQWPRQFGALLEKLGDDGRRCAERLRALLANAEAVAFLVANPAFGRYLRPLCRTLGVKLIPELRLKRRPRPARPAREKKPDPQAEPGPTFAAAFAATVPPAPQPHTAAPPAPAPPAPPPMTTAQTLAAGAQTAARLAQAEARHARLLDIRRCFVR